MIASNETLSLDIAFIRAHVIIVKLNVIDSPTAGIAERIAAYNNSPTGPNINVRNDAGSGHQCTVPIRTASMTINSPTMRSNARQ